MSFNRRRYSCETSAETLEWLNAVREFLCSYKHLLDAHVVNFFKDRLWETLDRDWMECLRRESIGNLLNIPSGSVQDYWPASLQEFILTLKSLVLPRELKRSHSMLSDMHVAPLNGVISQGMNLKKKHEVEILAAIVKTIANGVRSETIIDVGAGQGYLAQTLSFQYQLSVIAIDASLHHATVTSTRAERIKKHYAANLRKSQDGIQNLKVPQTVTCHVLSSDTLTSLSTASLDRRNAEHSREVESMNIDTNKVLKGSEGKTVDSCSNQSSGSSLVLAGLHACGDLSVNMLRTFANCDQVRAVVSVGCCYNLLSEVCSEKTSTPCGFPLSNAVKLSGFLLGKNARDLACQSAERWKCLTTDAARQNFELHVYRAVFQMVLFKFFPDVITSSLSIGRQGKALRRQQIRRVRESCLGTEGRDISPLNPSVEECEARAGLLTMKSDEDEVIDGNCNDLSPKDDLCMQYDLGCKEVQSFERYMLFEKFCKSGLGRLGLEHSKDIDFVEIWNEAQPYSEFVGPYWSLRAALGSLVETYILLDRLLFLQEQSNSVEAFIFPIFDPTISPRNVAVIARKADDRVEI